MDRSKLTRLQFLKAAAASAAGAAVGLRALGQTKPASTSTTDAAQRAAQPPPSESLPSGQLDSQKFRRAVIEGNLDLVRSYLDLDPALIYSRDESGTSVFVLAHLHRHSEIAALFVERGLKLDLVEATFHGDRERVQQLGKDSPGLVNKFQPWGGTAMHAAAFAGQTSMLFPIVSLGGNYDAANTDPPGITPLRATLEHPDLAVAEEMAESMLCNGADPNAPQRDGFSVLHAAAAAGSVEIVKLAIRKGAAVDATDDRGRTPLDVALRNGHEEVARILQGHEAIQRDHRADRFARTLSGEPFVPLPPGTLPEQLVNEFAVAAHGNYEKVERMLEEQPQLMNAMATWDEMPVEAAAHMGFPDKARFFLEHGAPLAIPTAGMLGRADLVRSMLDEDSRLLRSRGAHDFPLLWYAAFAGEHLDVAQLLIDYGIDVDSEKRGRTTLHQAARHGQVKLAGLLIEHGADVNARAKTRGGKLVTPLDVAVEREQTAVADVLRSNGGTAA